FVTMAFRSVDTEIEWTGQAENEVGVDPKSGRTLVRVNPKFFRPAEVELLIGDASKAKKLLGWEATTTLEELCRIMVEADLR
ncbi:GDP-mannose 4,6-dehydratase, partial [Acinetobacter baumannii]